jgi:hypothetical protein
MSELFIFIGMCLLGAFCVIGLIEWVKSVRDAVKAAVNKTGKVSTILWPVLSLVFAVGMGFALGKMPSSAIFGAAYNAVIFASVLMLSFNEILGYNVIVKLIFYWTDKIVYGDRIPDTAALKIEHVVAKIKGIIPDEIAAIPAAAEAVVPETVQTAGTTEDAVQDKTVIPDAAAVTGSYENTVTGTV